MDNNNIQASSILSLFATNNEQRQSFVSQIIDSIKNGKLSALNVHLQLKCMGIISEMITEDKAFKDAIKNEGVANVDKLNQEIKVTNCMQCPMCKDYLGVLSSEWNKYCEQGVIFVNGYAPEKMIDPNCPLKGQSITYKIGENEQ